VLATITGDIAGTTSSLFFSLAFPYQTKGPIQDAIKEIKKNDKIFSYGISDHKLKDWKKLRASTCRNPTAKWR
jgi:hypothetical protein